MCGFVAVATEWLITHRCLLSILDGLYFMFGKMLQQGTVNGFIFVSILEQQYFWWRFYRAFSNTLGFYSACLPFLFFRL